MSKKKVQKQSKNKNNKKKFLIILSVVVLVCVICFFVGRTHKKQLIENDLLEHGVVSNDDILPVCVYNDKGEIFYILYNNDDEQLFMFDAMPGFALDKRTATIHNLEFINQTGDQIFVTNELPDWCKEFYTGTMDKADSDYIDRIVKQYSTSGTTDMFGYDIWYDAKNKNYTAILEFSVENHIVITFKGELCEKDPIFHNLNTVKEYLLNYF